MTICAFCQHTRIEAVGGGSQYRCDAEKRPKMLDLVTGEELKNTLPFCRDINDGSCKKYVRLDGS